MEHSTFSFFKKLSNDNFCLVYSGNIIDEVTDKIIDLSEYNFEYHDDNKSSKRKISFLLAECFQNVIRHSEIPETGFHENRNFGFFLTRNMQGVNFITSGNLVKKDNIEILKTQLNQVNSLDQDGLKELYFNVITNRSFSNKGGAGLGLIEMARKSGEKIEYIFDEFDSEYSVFYSQVMLKAPKQILKHTGYHIVEAIEFHKLMRSENILMIQKGDFSNSSIFPVLEILQKNPHADFQQSQPQKGVLHVLIELLQNIAKYGVEQNGKREGILIIKKDEKNFIINAGNYVKENQKHTLISQIDFLNSLSKEEMRSKYLESIKEENQGAQIEMFEIARRASAAIRYNFQLAPSGLYFFSIGVTV